jgi:hypothetical protein
MITDHEGLRRVLDALLLNEDGFVVLHKEPELASGAAESDADLATSLCLNDALGRLRAHAAGLEMKVLSVWHYDTVSASTFLLTRSGVVQVDILSDLAGSGKYGLRTGVAVRNRVMGERWWRLSPLDEQLYLLRKRWVKRDLPRIREHVARATADKVLGDAHERAWQLFSPAARRSIAAALSGATPGRQVPRLHRAPEMLRRFARPPGALVDISVPSDEWPAMSAEVTSFMPRTAVHLGSPGPLRRARRWAEIRRPCLSLEVTLNAPVGARQTGATTSPRLAHVIYDHIRP